MVAKFPSAARDYTAAPLRLDDHLITSPASTFVLRASSDGPETMGVRKGDELLVDRNLPPRPGDIVIGIVSDEFKFGTYLIGGRITTQSGTSLLQEVWGVVTYVLHPTRRVYR